MPSVPHAKLPRAPSLPLVPRLLCRMWRAALLATSCTWCRPARSRERAGPVPRACNKALNRHRSLFHSFLAHSELIHAQILSISAFLPPSSLPQMLNPCHRSGAAMNLALVVAFYFFSLWCPPSFSGLFPELKPSHELGMDEFG